MAFIKDPSRFGQAVVGFAVIAGAIWLLPKAFQDTAERSRVASVHQAAEENSFRVVCPDHFELPFYQRWLSSTRWCESYRDRI